MDLLLELPEKVTEANIEDLISKEVEEKLDNLEESDYDDWLDELEYDGVKVGSLTFQASDVLKNCDPIAYRCGFTDYQESMRESIEDEVRQELESLME